ncbi:uncharacterized protein MYCFIDRAFT_83930 [Pseudocercospora fijiensis CIRAD86]|uniref:Uncharacterized protein n=1 Tax=Pseudocercospora fijiensis (strain CIRAD86) TaxID=383855 RepID=N1QBD3_PSEFD|nr:uncharacterized protein MYCFIDRAFT_83930 [Pseudocercospora fijiensis CIRAD86]EME88438.1 hypothetical protein MYCFIDRAFT_83930 [Pseudocercospora fijiensis CIRAD86]
MPPATGFSDEHDLDAVWAKILDKSNKITSWNLHDEPTTNFDCGMCYWQNQSAQRFQKNSKNVARNVFHNALRVSVFLEKLRIYLEDGGAETKLDKRLRKTVCRVLAHFPVIMGLAHKLTKRRVKLAARIGAFGGDPQAKDAMARLEMRLGLESLSSRKILARLHATFVA